ncbi:MAG: enolase C-terminal domain-like protein [Kiloniellales bacterium]|nr:enolase C-terminal domain-like protein [Kiloniellales bacterium]
MSETAELTFRALTTRAVAAPLARPLRTASGSIPNAPLLLLDVESEQGVTGRAWIFGYSTLTLRALAAFLGDLEAVIKGQPAAPAALYKDLEARFRLMGRQGLVGMALSGLDMALWDLQGRALSKPVVALLGGRVGPVPAYDSYGVVDPVADRAALEGSLEQGFRAIKIKIGVGDLAWDLENVAGVREVIGPEVRLMVDYNQSLTAPEALRRIAALERFDLTWVEEPVPAEDLAGHARVREGSAVPVQTGENWWFAADMAHAIAAGACDLCMPDLMKIGGITGWLRAMGQAEAAAIPVSSHLFIEASAHVLPVTPLAHYLEYLDLASPVIAEPPVLADGCVTPRGPGLGMDWDMAAVDRYGL